MSYVLCPMFYVLSRDKPVAPRWGNLQSMNNSCKTNHSQLSYPLTVSVVGATQMISQPVSSIFTSSPLPSGTWRSPGLSVPWCCLPTSSSVCLPPLNVPCTTVLAMPDEQKTCPYHWGLRFFTMVRRSSCGPIARWILAQISSLVTWSLYEMRSILQ